MGWLAAAAGVADELKNGFTGCFWLEAGRVTRLSRFTRFSAPPRKSSALFFVVVFVLLAAAGVISVGCWLFIIRLFASLLDELLLTPSVSNASSKFMLLVCCCCGTADGALVPNGSKLPPLVVEAAGADDACNTKNKKSLKIVST